MATKELSNPNAPEPKGWLESVKEWPTITREYFSELKLEMKRVTWPNRKQVETTTAIVIITVFAFAAYFYVVDKALGTAVLNIQKTFSK